MAVTNWTIVTRRKDNGTVVTFPLLSKWTYKTAVAVAKESIDTSTFEIYYRDWETDRKSTRLNSSHITRSRMPSSA